MNSLPNRPRSPTNPAGPWRLELGPLGCFLTVLWAKLVYLSYLLPSQWWALDESTRQWMGPLGYVFHSLLRHPHVLTATLGSLLLLFALFPLLGRTPRFISLLVINLVLTTLALGDLVHVRFYADVLSASDFRLAPALTGVLPNVLKALRPADALYYFDVIVGCAVLPAYARSSRPIPPLGLAPRARISVALAVLGLVIAAPTAWMVRHNRAELFSYTSVRIEAAATLGFLPYHLADLAAHLVAPESPADAAARERVRRYVTHRQARKAPASRLAGMARGRNVIVISAESLQAFPIGLEINGQAVMPRLAAFARQSLHFVNFYDQTYLGTTSDAEFMVMQSLHPLAAGVLVSQFHHHHFRGLPKIFAEQGYTTLSMCAAPGSFWHMDQMHPRLGFQKSYFEDSYAVSERINLWLSDREFFSQSAAMLAQQTRPFLAFLLSASNHHPYELPQAYKRLKLGDLEGTLVGDYLHSVHYFDQAFGEFVDKLRDAGLLEKSVIVLYGDHQGFLGDPPELRSLLGLPAADDLSALQTRKKIPLVIRLPHGKAAGARTTPGGQSDIAPTLLSLLGIVDDNNVMFGSDLTAARESLVVFRDGSFVSGTRYFAKRFGAPSGGACFDIQRGHPIGCESLQDMRRDAMERLEISDLIVRGDLIPELTRRLTTARLPAD